MKITSKTLEQLGELSNKEWDDLAASIEQGKDRAEQLIDIDDELEEQEIRKFKRVETMKQQVRSDSEEGEEELEDQLKNLGGYLVGVGGMALTAIGLVFGIKAFS